MTAELATIISGVVLVLVLALVGWSLRRRERAGTERERGTQGPPS